MNKKYLYSFVALLTIGLVSAGLIGYLSNTKTMEFDVQSPMVMKFDGETYADTATKDFGTVSGGANIIYKTWTWNRADIEIYAYPITTIISETDWTGSEFNSVIFKDANYPDGIEILDKLYVIEDGGAVADGMDNIKKFTAGVWNVADGKVLKLFFVTDVSGLRKYHHFADAEEWTQITTKLNDAITPGAYSTKLCHLYDITGNCQ